MPNTKVEGNNPIGNDGVGGASDTPDVKKYRTLLVVSTNHKFSAPWDKYKDLLGDLGLKDIDTDKAAREKAQKLAAGTGYVNIKCRVESGGTLSLVCDPEKVGTAVKAIRNNKTYDEDIINAYVPRRISYR
jgi:hypothetical protein